MKQPFHIIESTCVPLPLENVDTDQIIPARFLKATDKEGFGENLFRDWRYNADGSPKDFVLNDPTYSGCVLVAGRNFGSGSSREHAALVPLYLGVRAVIAKSFARIHMANLINSGILPLVFADPADYDAVAQGDELVIENAPAQVESGEEIVVKNVTRGTSFKTKLEVSPRLRKILLAGGLIYTIGGIIYALKLPLFNSRHKKFGSHEIFHIFVMLGSACHFIAMYFFVAPMPV